MLCSGAANGSTSWPDCHEAGEFVASPDETCGRLGGPLFLYIRIVSNIVDPLAGQIAARIRSEREQRDGRWRRSGRLRCVSRDINRIERAESSPTAVVLGKLAAAFHVSVSALLTPAEATGVHRMADAMEWHDPATGYRRRPITGPQSPADIAEVHLPPGASVPYPAASLAFQREAVWVLDGRLTFHEGDAVTN